MLINNAECISGAILWFSFLLKDTSTCSSVPPQGTQGFKPATFRSLVHQLYPLSYSHPIKINTSFNSQLYNSESPIDETQMDTFFQKLDFPRVSPNDHQALDAPLTLSEIKETISPMNSGKSPGPDGYPVEFYKRFSNQLAPLLLEVFNHSYSQGSLPATLRQSSISLIHKKDKDPLNCASYRLISLLPVDVKILAKILARCLGPIVPLIILEDQTGFIAWGTPSQISEGFLASFILHPLLQIQRWLCPLTPRRPLTGWNGLNSSLPSSDLVLAPALFPESNYCIPFLICFCMHKHTVLWSFPSLPWHTPRVPPFSTVVHACHWAVSIALKSEGGLKGIKRHGVEYRVSLYAGDLLLFVSDPLSSLPSILSTLDSFSVFSRYKLKVSKSECFPINQLATEIPTHLIPFKTAVAGIKHLLGTDNSN